MADQLYVSYWLRGFTEHNMMRHFEAALKAFPVSRLQPSSILQVRAIDLTEPPVFEKQALAEATALELFADARWFFKPDTACELETCWDLWTLDGEEWKIAPARVIISCYAPLFPSELGEQIRIEFGRDTQFLPQLELTSSLAPVRHNIRSLLHLVSDLDEALPAEKRLLWSESGDNFAERLQSVLADE